ncbi:exodeoxyribonuclease VII large subunit [Rhodocyclus gracilis]|uniref:Exodeoxyribonuclease 7 large subunit n=1 Tax=Rhodocyclus tenuis TaxID=1066 RepID=A0A6L5JXE7_RHOTE|nr:exodeoxyribonuclease VII large subunit [Rhodocyclus gracilis]MQY52037.1 exodeoxyribonuclease VII large subunit [Rhodocyclus gracilis]
MANAATAAIPVSLLIRRVRERIESGFPLCWVSGEVSNLVQAASGHCYFSLKDANAQVRCVMFRQRVQTVGFRLENGLRVEARVLPGMYEARGEFQLNVDGLRRAGVGDLFERFQRLKEKLEREGLFADDGKRRLPPFPRRIGVVTSPQAAALRDVITTLRRRAPQIDVLIYPATVQGEDSAEQLTAALTLAAQRHAQDQCDALILCRGGGSLEDLQSFNDEALARAIYASPVPVISGVGHETDFTIADFVADCRAPTPTAAAEMAAPDAAALRARLAELSVQLRRSATRRLEYVSQRLDWLTRRLQHPAQRLAAQADSLRQLQRRLASALMHGNAVRRSQLGSLTQRLLLARPDAAQGARRIDALAHRLTHARRRLLEHKAARVGALASSLEHLNPRAVLARGYSIVSDENGRIVSDARTLEPSQRLTVSFRQGQALTRIESLREQADPVFRSPSEDAG